MISVRLPKDLEVKLNSLSQQENISKSEIIKEVLGKYLAEKEKNKDPYGLGEDLFGKHGSRRGDLSAKYKKEVGEKINEKKSR